LGPALDWFDRSPEAMQLRNQPAPPPRMMSEKMQIQAGLKKDPDSVHTHKDDKPMISMQETAHMAKEATRKKLGLPSEEEEWKTKAESISVTTKSGKFDHRRTQELRQSFAHTDATKTKIDWKQTHLLRQKLADQILKEQQKG
jgi:hypothetical protein